jgi:GPH family glycoside/pentoside/hexuronide:cation symporter
MTGAGAATPVAAVPAPGLSARTLGAYGLMGFPFAMAALPVYVHLPKFYGEHLGVPLATLGLLLLVLRIADGVLDPMLGALCDRARSRKHPIALAAPVLALGMVALFMPPARAAFDLIAWLALTLTVVYVAFSVATISHGAWGAELSVDPVERTRVTAARESLALAGVVVASAAPSMLGGTGGEAAGLPRFALIFAATIVACTACTLAFAPPAPRPEALRPPVFADLATPLRDVFFRRLLAVFVANGIAASIPATLVLFFIADVLRAEARQGIFLALYFIAAAAGMPLWVRLSARVGKVRAWYAAMALAVVAFVWAAWLGPGDITPFAVICVASGLAFGADLALAPSLLADVIGRDGRMHATGAYFGLWTLATKLNLAVAAGIALPLLGALGYAPGVQEPSTVRALSWVYAGLPCVLKLAAVASLVWFNHSWSRRT